MKIKQGFSPITITLESQDEADVFISIIDKIDQWISHSEAKLKLNDRERHMVVNMSNAYTDIGGLRDRISQQPAADAFVKRG